MSFPLGSSSAFQRQMNGKPSQKAAEHPPPYSIPEHSPSQPRSNVPGREDDREITRGAHDNVNEAENYALHKNASLIWVHELREDGKVEHGSLGV